MKRAFPVFMWTACLGFAVAQSRMAEPRAGFILDTAGTLRPLLGVAGAFVPGEPALSGVLKFAHSGRGGFAKTETALVILDSSGAAILTVDAPLGPALFAFGADQQPALVFYPQSGELFRIGAEGLEKTDLQLDGDIIAIAMDQTGALLALAADGSGSWLTAVSLETGATLARRRGPEHAEGALLGSDGSITYRDGNQIVRRDPDGGERRFTAPEGLLAQAGNGWIQAGRKLIRTAAGAESIYEIPEAQQ